VLVASGVATALVVVPGIAQAAPTDPAAPLSEVTEGLQDAGGQLGGTSGDTSPLPAGEGMDPDALAALLEELGVPAECVTGFQEVLEGIAADLAASPEEVPDELAGLVAGLQAAFEKQDPAEVEAALTELLGASGLAQLDEVAAACLPEEEPEPQPQPAPAPVVVPSPQPPAPAPVAPAAPVAKPVAYPGYAPTGVTTTDAADATVPLAIAGLVLLSAGAAGYGMRRRAVSARH
jgi:hypothetical protein